MERAESTAGSGGAVKNARNGSGEAWPVLSAAPAACCPLRYCFILNPTAQSRRAGRRRAELEAALARRGVAYALVETQRPGHAEGLAREAAAGHDVVVAAGGDGTVQEVARGLYAAGLAGTAAALGVLPMGTGNDFARALGMPRALGTARAFGRALDALLAAPTVALDLGRVRCEEQAEGGAPVRHEAVFTNGLGIGFDALAALGARRFKALGGRAAYLIGVLHALRAWQRTDVAARVVTGDGPAERMLHDGPVLLIEIGNGPSVGGGFLLTPDAVPGDGLLDVCAVARASTGRILRILPSAFSGGHVGAPEVAMGRARRVTIRLSAPLPVHADGEALTPCAWALDVEVLPGALHARAPALRRPPG